MVAHVVTTRSGRRNAAKLPSRIRSFVDIAKPRGAWLGICEGSELKLVSTWGARGLHGSTYEIRRNPLLLRLKRSRAPIICHRDSAQWRSVPHPLCKADTYWACIPLLVGREFAGAVGVWGHRPPQRRTLNELRALARRLAPAIDAEAKLDRLAADLEHAASVAQDFGDVPAAWGDVRSLAQHTLRRIKGAIPDAAVTLAVPDWHSFTFHEFRLAGGRFTSANTPFVEALVRPSPKHIVAGRVGRKRPGDASGGWTALSLSGKGTQEGALLIRLASSRPENDYLEIIRSRIIRPLAQLVLYAREREARSAQDQKLGLIVALSSELAGLLDTRQIVEAAAGKIAQLFEGGLTRIVLSDGGTTALMAASAGSVGAENRAVMPMDVADVDKALSARVLGTGQSLLVRGAEARRRLGLKSVGFAGSAICVPIKEHEHVLGTMEIRRQSSRALDEGDVGSIECLAAIVASSVVFARTQDSASAAVSSTSRRTQRIPEDRLIRAAKLISVGEMAAGIAHELNNPLTTVTGFTELILDEIPPDAAYRADVEMVLQEARRARSVVRRLLDFARQGEGTRSRSDIGEIMDDVLGLTTHLMRTNGVRLDFVRAENLPWVLANTNQLKQVFLNLVHNALQAMPAGGKLAVTIELQSESGREWVVVRIKDNGLGIRPGDLPRIFEPFFTTRADHGGTGLGLSVSYGIVSEHGGRIDVESQPGHGSTFSVWLPV
jgi:signal transduction histidine kinase